MDYNTYFIIWKHILQIVSVVAQFALWNPGDLGYLSIHILNALATGKIKGVAGEKFTAGKLGEYTIQEDADLGVNVLLGLPFIYNAENIDQFNW